MSFDAEDDFVSLTLVCVGLCCSPAGGECRGVMTCHVAAGRWAYDTADSVSGGACDWRVCAAGAPNLAG